MTDTSIGRYALINNDGVVSSVIMASSDFAAGINAIACANDVGPGWLYNDGAFSAPPVLPPDTALLAASAREKRNALLAESDWTQLADAPVDSLAWSNYRQALRDVPQQLGFPLNIVWPVAP